MTSGTTDQQPAAAGRVRRCLKRTAMLAATLLVVWLLTENVKWQGVADVLASVRWPWLVAMSGLAVVRTLLDSYQMKETLRRLKLRVALSRIFLGNTLSNFYALIIPGALLSRGAKWGVLTAATGRGSAVLHAMMYNGMIQLMPVLVVGGIAMAIERPWPGSGLTETTVMASVGAVALIIGLYHPRVGAITARRVRRIVLRLPERIARRTAAFLDSLDDFRRFRWKWHAQSLAIASAMLGCALLRMFFGFRALQIDLSPVRIAWIFIFLHVLRQLPITIGNFGVREGFLMVALAGFNVPNETAISLGLLLYTDRLVPAGIGAAYQAVLLAKRRPQISPSCGRAEKAA